MQAVSGGHKGSQSTALSNQGEVKFNRGRRGLNKKAAFCRNEVTDRK